MFEQIKTNTVEKCTVATSTKTDRPQIIASIPCFNTEHSIREVVSRARKHVDQVVVIDDGSYDGTSEAARAAGALVIRHGVNVGYGEAIRSCLEVAKANDIYSFPVKRRN